MYFIKPSDLPDFILIEEVNSLSCTFELSYETARKYESASKFYSQVGPRKYGDSTFFVDKLAWVAIRLYDVVTELKKRGYFYEIPWIELNKLLKKAKKNITADWHNRYHPTELDLLLSERMVLEKISGKHEHKPIRRQQ